MKITASTKLTLADIDTLAHYQQQRPAMRQAIIAHKKHRRVALGSNVTLHFEDRATMKYQVLEMLRAGNLHSEEAIADELDAYNPLIPDGHNLKCTLMIEYSDASRRKAALRALVGLEHHVCIQINGHPPVPAIADEDLPRSTADKTSAVHFLRFEFTADMIAAARSGAPWVIYSGHPAYQQRVDPLPDAIASALSRDFEPDQTH